MLAGMQCTALTRLSAFATDECHTIRTCTTTDTFDLIHEVETHALIELPLAQAAGATLY